MKNKIIIGISGFIGSGKTTAGNYLSRLGALFINADKVVKDLYKPGGRGSKKIAAFLGRDFLKNDGSVSRKKLARFAFGDPRKMEILNNLIHPLVFEEIRGVVSKSKARVVFIEAIYFRKNMLGSIIDGMIFIESTKRNILGRAALKGNYTKEQIGKILGMQKRPENVDWMIKNNAGKVDLINRLKEVWLEIQQRIYCDLPGNEIYYL